MDINLSSQTAVPAQQQPQTAPSATSEAGATTTVQKTPDNVVTAATQSVETNVRDDDALRRQHRGMRLRTGDVLRVHFLVEADRRIDRFHDSGWTRGKTPPPNRAGRHVCFHAFVRMRVF